MELEQRPQYIGSSECLHIKIFTCDQQTAALLSFILDCVRYFSNIFSHFRGGIIQHSEVCLKCSRFSQVTQIIEFFSGFPELSIHRQS